MNWQNRNSLISGFNDDEPVNYSIMGIDSIENSTDTSNSMIQQFSLFQPDFSQQDINSNRYFQQPQISPKQPEKWTNYPLIQTTHHSSKSTQNPTSDNARGTWTQQEDQQLIAAIKQFGDNKWSEISKVMKSRSAKQIRERWTNCLQPGLKREPFEQWEDDLIVEKQKEIGNKWAMIARSIPGRSAGAIKNRWYSFLKNAQNHLPRRNPIEIPIQAKTNLTNRSNQQFDAQPDQIQGYGANYFGSDII